MYASRADACFCFEVFILSWRISYAAKLLGVRGVPALVGVFGDVAGLFPERSRFAQTDTLTHIASVLVNTAHTTKGGITTTCKCKLRLLGRQICC